MADSSFDRILELSVSERVQLVQDIWDSIATEPEALPLSEAQKDELRSRLASYRANPGAGSPWADVRRRLWNQE